MTQCKENIRKSLMARNVGYVRPANAGFPAETTMRESAAGMGLVRSARNVTERVLSEPATPRIIAKNAVNQWRVAVLPIPRSFENGNEFTRANGNGHPSVKLAICSIKPSSGERYLGRAGVRAADKRGSYRRITRIIAALWQSNGSALYAMEMSTGSAKPKYEGPTA
jgi:hypothetical protein